MQANYKSFEGSVSTTKRNRNSHCEYLKAPREDVPSLTDKRGRRRAKVSKSLPESWNEL
jgi:hypothetical protein